MFAIQLIILQDITLYIAIYGAGLSTLLALVRLLLDRRIRIKVNVTPGLTVPDFNKASAYLEFPLESRFLLPMGPYQRRTPADNPYEIAAGRPDLTISYDNKEIAEALKKGYSGKVPFRASVDGVGGKRYKSKKKLIDANTGFVINKSSRLKWLYWTLRKKRYADKRT